MAFTMGQAVSTSHFAAEKEKVLLARDARQPLLRRDFSYSLDGAADDDSYSFTSSHLTHSKRSPDKMMTQSSLLTLPMAASSRDLAYFLRSTGPGSFTLSSGKPDKPPRPPSRSGFRFFMSRSKRARSDARNQLNEVVLYDEGGLLLPPTAEQKVSSAGKRYIALKPKIVEVGSEITAQASPCEHPAPVEEPSLSPPAQTCDRSHASGFAVALADDVPTAERYDRWYSSYVGGRTSPVSPISAHKTSTELDSARAPSPELVTGPSMPMPVHSQYTHSSHATIPALHSRSAQIDNVDKVRSGLAQHPATDTTDTTDMDFAKYQVPRIRKPVTPMPTLALPKEEFPVRVPRADKECEIKHPSPRRFASHPVLQRKSSLAEATLSRSDNESPATPPPKSPLRLRREHRLVERPLDTICQTSIQEVYNNACITAPSRGNAGTSAVDAHAHLPRMVGTVTTQCTGPLTRHVSLEAGSGRLLVSRKEREERIHARKPRDRPRSIARANDAVVYTSPTSSQRRLRKTRPKAVAPVPRSVVHEHIHQDLLCITRQSTESKFSTSEHSSIDAVAQLSTPDLRPAPLNTRSSSAAATPSNRSSELTASTPISPARTSDSANLSPRSMLLVAEEISLPKAKSPFRPAKIVVAKERVYTPRPRSASMPRSTPLRRSRNSISLPSRVLTPEPSHDNSATPPLPSPPPNRALPPTPPASGSEKIRKRSCRIPTPQKMPIAQVLPPTGVSATNVSTSPPQVASRQYTTQARQPSSWDDAQLRARLEVLESRNKWLEDAVMAMINAHGPASNPMAAFLRANIAMGVGSAVDQVHRAKDVSSVAGASTTVEAAHIYSA